MKFRRRTARERFGLARVAATRTRKAARRKAGGPVVRATLLGTPVEIVYRHADGGTYRHKFSATARLSYTADGVLLIDGRSVKAFIE